MKRWLPVLLPLVVLVGGGFGAWVLLTARQDVETRPPEILPPLVRVVEAKPQTLQLRVTSQGTVMPRTETSLVPEVAGRVVAISPSLVDGGFFGRGDVLLSIDPRDYELALARTRSMVAQAETQLAREIAEAQVARREWRLLGRGEPSPLTSRTLHVAEAKAALAAARAITEQAAYNLARTKIRAPFAGRVRDKQVDLGQYVVSGAPIATIYAVDAVEIRLPIPDSELAYLDLSLRYQGDDVASQPGPTVRLWATFAGKVHEWSGRIVRTEGEIDRKTRVVYAVVRVEDPYGRGPDPERPPLAVGMFVEAKIMGKVVENVVVLPRAAMRSHNQVLIVDDERRLRFRTVEILRADREQVVVQNGLTAGERVSMSALDAVIDGMKVRTIESKEMESTHPDPSP
jgi:RND family efflux transporter MFP subunit